MRYMAIVRRPEGPEGLWSVENIDAKELCRVETRGCMPVDGSIPDITMLRWLAAGINAEEKMLKKLHKYYQEHPRVFKLSRWYAYWVEEFFKSR